MSMLISSRIALDALRDIREVLWGIDIPHPTCPEYIEHHKQIQRVMKLVDTHIARISALEDQDAHQDKT